MKKQQYKKAHTKISMKYGEGYTREISIGTKTRNSNTPEFPPGKSIPLEQHKKAHKKISIKYGEGYTREISI